MGTEDRDAKRADAQARLLNEPLMSEPVDGFGPHGVRATREQFVAGAIWMAARAKAQRQALRGLAKVARAIDSGEIRKLIAEVASNTITATPDAPVDVQVFLHHARQLADVAENVQKFVPPSAKKSWARDPIDDDSPSQGRVKGVIARNTRLPGLGAPLRDLLWSVGIEEPKDDSVASRDKCAKLKRRGRSKR